MGLIPSNNARTQTLEVGSTLSVQGTVAIESGGALTVGGVTVDENTTAVTGLTASADELNLTDNMPASISFAAAAGASNITNVTCTVKDAAGVAIAAVFTFDIWLSDAATGAGLTAVTASGTVTAKTASGIVIATNTAKKALRVQTLATGVFVLEITDSAKTAFYVCAELPSVGSTQVSAALITGNYG